MDCLYLNMFCCFVVVYSKGRHDLMLLHGLCSTLNTYLMNIIYIGFVIKKK